MTPIPPNSCTIFEADIDSLKGNTILHISSTGDYKVGEDRPKCGELEIEVIGGSGDCSKDGSSLPSLKCADPTLFFRFGDFVVCKASDPCVKEDEEDSKSIL